MDGNYLGPNGIGTAIYAFAAIFAIAACWLLFSVNMGRERSRRAGHDPHWLGLENALTATALALGLAGIGFLLSLWW